MKSIKENFNFSLLKIMERLKNGDVKVSVILLHIVCILLLCTQDSATNGMDLTTATCFELFKKIPMHILEIHAITFKLFIFTPRKLNYRMSNVLILLILSLIYSFQLFTIPINIFLFDKVWSQLTVALSWLFMLYFYYCIKKVFCPPNYKRIYVFIALDILTNIL